MNKKCAVSFLVLACAVVAGGCDMDSPGARKKSDADNWGTVAAELDSLQAAQQAFKDSLRVKNAK